MGEGDGHSQLVVLCFVRLFARASTTGSSRAGANCIRKMLPKAGT